MFEAERRCSYCFRPINQIGMFDDAEEHCSHECRRANEEWEKQAANDK